MMASFVRGALALVAMLGLLMVMGVTLVGNALSQAATGAIVTAAVVCLIGLLVSLDSGAAEARRKAADQQAIDE